MIDRTKTRILCGVSRETDEISLHLFRMKTAIEIASARFDDEERGGAFPHRISKPASTRRV